MWSLRNDVFERRTSTESGLIAFLGSDSDEIFVQIVSLRVKTLGNTNFVASRHIRKKQDSLPVGARGKERLCLSSLMRKKTF